MRSDATGYVDDPRDESHPCADCGDVLTLDEGIKRVGEQWVCESCMDKRDDGPCPGCGCLNVCICDQWEASAER